LQEANATLRDCVTALNCETDHTFKLPLCPVGYEDNNGQVSTQVPISRGYYVDAKWVQQHNDRWVDLLVGKDFDKEPYSTDIFLNPSYSDKVTKPLPCWFNNLLAGPTPAYHALHKAMSDLNNWNMVTKITMTTTARSLMNLTRSRLNLPLSRTPLLRHIIASKQHTFHLSFLTLRDVPSSMLSVDTASPSHTTPMSATMTMEQELHSRMEGDVIARYR